MAPPRACIRRLKFVWRWRKLLIFFLAPLVFVPLPIVFGTPESKVAYMLLIMAVYWVTEALPIGVTALIPVVLVPLFKIIPSKTICPAYFSDSNMLFVGGLLLAISVEFWDLHRRMALLVLQLVGVQPRWLLLGFMLPTWFMSMWISNTATAAMMLPIVDAVLQELMRYDQLQKAHRATSAAVAVATAGQEEQRQILVGAEDAEAALPMAVVEPNNHKQSQDAADADAAVEPPKYTVLEYIQQPENAEFRGACKMLTIAVAYSANYGGTPTLTGTPPNLVLNNNLISYFGNKTPFNFGTWFLFAFPVSIFCLMLAWVWLQILFMGPKSLCKRSTKSREEADAVAGALKAQYERLGPITFPEVSCIILFSIPLLVLIVTYCTTLITEITSNTATASILLPILVDLCRSLRLNPLNLMLPCTIAASLAFNLPIATPPNSIVFSKGYLTVVDMMKSGFMLTIVSGLVVIVATLTYGTLIFDLQTYPDWAGNATVAAG